MRLPGMRMPGVRMRNRFFGRGGMPPYRFLRFHKRLLERFRSRLRFCGELLGKRFGFRLANGPPNGAAGRPGMLGFGLELDDFGPLLVCVFGFFFGRRDATCRTFRRVHRFLPRRNFGLLLSERKDLAQIDHLELGILLVVRSDPHARSHDPRCAVRRLGGRPLGQHPANDRTGYQTETQRLVEVAQLFERHVPLHGSDLLQRRPPLGQGRKFPQFVPYLFQIHRTSVLLRRRAAAPPLRRRQTPCKDRQ